MTTVLITFEINPAASFVFDKKRHIRAIEGIDLIPITIILVLTLIFLNIGNFERIIES